MNQVAIVYEKETKRLITLIEFTDIITNCNILKVPGVEVVITLKVDGLLYVKNNAWYVNEKLVYRKK